jgi:tetratricopeptide (TPR) repeat protein
MNVSSQTALAIAALAAALVVVIIILPPAASTWSLNSANAAIVRAASLPSDASARTSALGEADARLSQARAWSAYWRLALARARLALARGEPQRAADVLASVGTALSSDSIAQFVWADAAWQSQQPTVAYERWRAAGALEYFTQQMHRARDSQQWKEAEDLARIAIGIDPDLADAHHVLADALSHQVIDNPEALRELDRAAALARDNDLLSTVLSRKGEILASQGKWQDALDVFAEAHRAAPIDARPRTGYALTLLQLRPDARDEAVALLTQVTTDSPWYSDAYIGLAQIAESRGDVRGAEEWLQKGLARNPNNASVLFALGKLYARQHRTDEARTALTLALKYETRVEDRQAITRALAELEAR